MHRTRYPLATLALLGRAGMFSGAQERVRLIERVGQPDVYEVPERPCFVRVKYQNEDGKKLAPTQSTDSGGAGWFVWPPGMPRTSGRRFMLRPETIEERAYKEPIRVLTIAQSAWDMPGKNGGKGAPILSEEWR